MLGARHQENAHVGRVGHVLASVHGDGAQRGVAAAVIHFRFGILVDDLGLEAGGNARAQAVHLAGHEISDM